MSFLSFESKKWITESFDFAFINNSLSILFNASIISSSSDQFKFEDVLGALTKNTLLLAFQKSYIGIIIIFNNIFY